VARELDERFGAPGPCAYACGNPHTGIGVRIRCEQGWEVGLICDACWNQEHPDRVPVRMVEPKRSHA
jgi:hypothetical protein